MSGILDQLEAKPVPQKYQEIKIVIPQKGQIEVKAKIIDKRSEGYNRSELKKRLKKKGLSISTHVPTTVSCYTSRCSTSS